jgi:rRNA maturation protein Nop10
MHGLAPQWFIVIIFSLVIVVVWAANLLNFYTPCPKCGLNVEVAWSEAGTIEDSVSWYLPDTCRRCGTDLTIPLTTAP